MVKGEYSATSSPSGGRGQHGHTPHLSELEGRLHIQRVKNVFNGDFIGLVFANDLAELLIDSGQSPRQRLAGRKFNRSACEASQFPGAGHLHHAEAGVFSPAINAQNAHVHAVYRRKAQHISTIRG